ncbi:uncharacterized protein LOC109428658 [Aedes albopictus]|uniref:Secreted protein n=1 Tax=Aedes albopictus TaxID=7160 RepID=A0ABM1YJ90_AEDAL
MFFSCYRHALFLVRSWRNWCVKKFGNLKNCVTTNAYWGLEINAHSLINYIVHCRVNGTEFNPNWNQSQACESTFREARAFTSTESTVVNFTIQGFESRLSRIQFKKNVMHRNAHVLNFPSLKNNSIKTEKVTMPTNDEIIREVEKAQASVERILIELGIDSSDICFDSSVTTKCLTTKQISSSPEVEFITVPEEYGSDDDVQENIDEEAYAFDESEFITVPEEFAVYEKEIKCDVHDASELFENIGEEILLPDSKNFKNVFKIKNRRNKIIHVKKRTFLWMLTSGLQKCSTDRTYRFFDKPDKSNSPRYCNEVLEKIVVGEYVLLRMNQTLRVFKIYGFKYLNRKNNSYCAAEVSLKIQKDDTHSSVGLTGCLFELVNNDEDYLLDFISNNQTIDVKHYVSHLIKPTVDSAIFFYPEEIVEYINQYN